MDLKDVERQKKHLGYGGYLELKNEDGSVDRFYLPQLTLEHAPDLLYVMSKFQKANPENPLEGIDKQTFKILIDLVMATINMSPDFRNYSEEEKKRFVHANLIPLITKLFEINDMGAAQVSADIEAIKKARTIRRLREHAAARLDKRNEGAEAEGKAAQ